MQYVWDERKRLSNLKDHGIDFADAQRVIEGLTFTFEDDRFNYGERRLVTLGLLEGVPVSIVHLETDNQIRVISFRKATDHETQILFSEIQDQLPPAPVSEKPRHPRQRRTPGGKPKARRPGHRSKGPKGRPS